jgi:formylglycine-generating enzyme required for sulfatase activity
MSDASRRDFMRASAIAAGSLAAGLGGQFGEAATHMGLRTRGHNPKAVPLTGEYVVIDLLAESETIAQLAEAPSDLLTNDLYKTTSMVLRRIPKGTFTMGSPDSEKGREPYEKGSETQHEVTLTDDFYIAVFQCTQRQYKTIAGNNPNEEKHEAGGLPAEYVGDKLPVGNVSWYQARGGTWPGGDPDPASFMGKLRHLYTKTYGLSPDSKWGFNLPTEAQWEYACRAGTTNAYNNDKDCLVEKLMVDDQEVSSDAQDENLDPLAHYRFNTWCLDKGPQEVGGKQPNNWGLFDMHGNCWDWCLDLYEDYDGPTTDPVGASLDSGSVYRMKRGGCGNTQPYRCRSANRSRRDSSDPFIAVGWGFRVALPIDG